MSSTGYSAFLGRGFYTCLHHLLSGGGGVFPQWWEKRPRMLGLALDLKPINTLGIQAAMKIRLRLLGMHVQM
eukprot:364537-Chlamydomonas_euryale.AAC.1